MTKKHLKFPRCKEVKLVSFLVSIALDRYNLLMQFLKLMLVKMFIMNI